MFRRGGLLSGHANRSSPVVHVVFPVVSMLACFLVARQLFGVRPPVQIEAPQKIFGSDDAAFSPAENACLNQAYSF